MGCCVLPWAVGHVSGEALIGRGMAAVGGLVYMFGGANYGPPVSYTDFAQSYNPVTRAFSSIRPLPYGRYNAEAQRTPDGDIVVFGGYDGSSYLSETFIYSVSGDSYSVGDPMPYETQSHTSVELLSGDIVSFGGSSALGYLSSAAKYSSGVWSQLPDMPFAASYMASCVMDDGHVLLAGGVNSGGMRSDFYSYDPDSGDYAQLSSAPVAMRGAILERVDDDLCVYVSGEVSPDRYNSVAHYYKPSEDKWFSAEALPYRTAFADSVVINSRLMIVGGNTKHGQTQRASMVKVDL